MLRPARFLSLSVVCGGLVLATGCGGGGGGSDDSTAPEVPFGTTQNGITLTEDRALNQNLGGVWIEYSDVAFTTETTHEGVSIRTQASETARKTIFVIDNDGEDLIIRDCLQFATDVAEGSNTIEFTLGTARYVLHKRSNTRMQGNFDFDAEDAFGRATGQGEADIVKVAPGPATLSALLLDDFSIGTLEYSEYGNAPRQMNVQCISDSVGTATVSRSDAPQTSYSYSGFVLESVFGDFLSLINNSAIAGEKSLVSSLYGLVVDITKESEADFVNFSASDTNGIVVEFEANAERYADETTADAPTLSGRARLSL